MGVPAPLSTGSVKCIDRTVAYWTFRLVKHSAKGLVWNRCLALIEQRQNKWEGAAAAIVDGAEPFAAKCVALEALAVDAVNDWWALNDEMLLRFGDGWEYEWAEDGESRCRPVAYPEAWLKAVGFFRGEKGSTGGVGCSAVPAPPDNTVWTLEKKLGRAAQHCEPAASRACC